MEEATIQIISRIDSDNPLKPRCVSKVWKSLVVDHVFVRNHLYRLLTDFSDVNHKNSKHFLLACKPLILNNSDVPQEEEDEDEEEDEGGEDDDDEEGDDKEERKGEIKEKQFWVKLLSYVS